MDASQRFSQSAHPLPQRHSLVDQVVVIVREGVAAARWQRELPSEAELCRELQVSRVTLRKALAQLAQERWIVLGGRGRPHVIRRRSSVRAPVAGRTVRVLSPEPSIGLGTLQQATLETLTERIAAEGYRMEFEHRPQLFQRHQAAMLRRLDALPDTAGWILFYSTEKMQRWFAASGRPCVVAGPLHEGVALSCVFPDTPAFGRHAAGRLCARGYSELVYLMQTNTSLGALRASVTFTEEAHRHGVRARIIKYGLDAQDMRAAIGGLLAERPRPDGFVSAHAGHAVTILCCLLSAGVRVPNDAAVISGWDDPFLDFTTPTMTRYRVDGVKFGRQLASVILDQLKNGSGKLRTVQIVPELVRGGTLADAATV